MLKSRINVEVLKECTVIIMLRSRDIINFSLGTSVDVSYVLTYKIEDIKKENVLKESIFEKLKYSQSNTIVSCLK